MISLLTLLRTCIPFHYMTHSTSIYIYRCKNITDPMKIISYHVLNTAFSLLIAIHNFLNQTIILWLCRLTVCAIIPCQSRLLRLHIDLLCLSTCFHSQSRRLELNHLLTVYSLVGPWQLLSTSLSIDLWLGLTTHQTLISSIYFD